MSVFALTRSEFVLFLETADRRSDLPLKDCISDVQ